MIFEISIIVSAIGFYSVFNFFQKRNFWKTRKVKGPDPPYLFGNFKDAILGKCHPAELSKKFYDEFREEPMVGIFVYNTPVLILRDLDFIQDVLIKDFSAFSDRGICVYDKVEPLSQHFFNLPHSTSRVLRMKLSPAFSFLKIKNMFNMLKDITGEFIRYVENTTKISDNLECNSILAKYTTEVIGEYGFGLKMHQFMHKNNHFDQVHSKRTRGSYYNYVRRHLREYSSNIYKHCYAIFYNKTSTDYYLDMVRSIAIARQYENFQKKDYASILLDLQKDLTINNIEWTDTFVAAQAYVFFTAGSDTTALIISNALYELAYNQIIQEKLRFEIDSKFQENIQNLTCYDVKNMIYLDKIYKETLRKYPLRDIIRQSNRSYTFRGTNVTIPANVRIIIPHYAIHRDVHIYHDPDIFNPERFDDGNIPVRHPMAYLPFGSGPRNCIGQRLAEVLCKNLIVNIIKNFKLEVIDELDDLKKNDPRKVLLTLKGGIRLKFTKL